jgi:hypothetical protein
MPLPTIVTLIALTVGGGFLGWKWPRFTATLAVGCVGAWLGLMVLAVLIYVATTGSADFSWVRSAANSLMDLSRYAGQVLLGAIPLTLGKLVTTHLRNQSVKQ